MNLPVEKLREFCRNEGIAYMAVFGSVADGTARPDSDIDILVSFVNEMEMDLFHFFDIKNRLSDLLKRRVDLVAKNSLHPRVKATIETSLREVFPRAA